MPRWRLVTVLHGHTQIRLFYLYGPQEDDEDDYHVMLTSLSAEFLKYNADPKIASGDFNAK